MPNITKEVKIKAISSLDEFAFYSHFKENGLKDLPLSEIIFFMDMGSLEAKGKALVLCVERWSKSYVFFKK